MAYEEKTKNGVTYWELTESRTNPKSYNCSEYTARRLEGKKPRLAPDRPHPDKDYQVDTDEIEQFLIDKGFTAHTVAADGSPKQACECTPVEKGDCGAPAQACVVLYVLGEPPTGNAVNPADREVTHVALYDPKRCDWGAKEGARGEIIRHKTAADYLKMGDPDAAKAYMVFYCKTQANIKYPSDETFHAAATTMNRDGTFPGGPEAETLE